jgi:hypothetical protein
MNTDKETWLVEEWLTKTVRVVTGRKAMIDKVSAITGQAIAKSQNPWNTKWNGAFWVGILERPTTVGDKAFAHGPEDSCFLAIVTRVLGPDDAGY